MADDTSTTSTETGDGDGGSATDTDQAGTATQETATATGEGLGAAGQTALARERTAARDANRRAKAAEAELAKLREASMSDQEKAVAQARREADEAARVDERGKAGSRLVAAEFRAALAGRLDDKRLPDVIGRLDHRQFLTEDGEVDEKAVRAFADALAPARPPSFDGGARGGGAGSTTDMNTLIRRAAGISSA